MTLEEALDSPRYALTRMDRPASWENDTNLVGATVYLHDEQGFRIASVRTTVGEVQPLLKARGRFVHNFR